MSTAAAVFVRPIASADRDEWRRMRVQLWPGDHDPEIEAHFAGDRSLLAVFVADRGDGRLCGFIELGERSFAEGCASSPVAYVEGWFVDAKLRRLRVGAALLRAAENWAREAGYAEIGSDALIDNAASIAAHKSLGFQEIERVATFAKRL